MKFRQYVGQVIREIRQFHGLTLTDVSDFGNISIATISDTERGVTSTSEEIIEAIAKVLRTSVADIMLEASVRFSAAEIENQSVLRTTLSVSRP